MFEAVVSTIQIFIQAVLLVGSLMSGPNLDPPTKDERPPVTGQHDPQKDITDRQPLEEVK